MAAPLASRATMQTARKAPSQRAAEKFGVCVVALLGFVVQATTFVARLASIRILPATQSAEDLIRGSLGAGAAAGAPRLTMSLRQLAPLPAPRCASPSPGAAATRSAKLKEPLIKSSPDCVARKMRMAARRATKVVAWTTKPRSATTQTPHFAATRRDGALRAVCVVARLAKGDDH